MLPHADPARERQRARDRLRSVTPQDAAKILTHHRYWTPQFFELYVARCDQAAFDAPLEAYQLAQYLPELARRIRVGSALTAWDTPKDKRAGVVLALAVRGTCCYENQEVDESALCFSRAIQGLGDHEIEPNIAAEIYRRYAVLLSMRGELSAARSALEKATQLATQRDTVADCLALETFLYSETDPARVLLAGLQSYPLADLKSARGHLAAEVAFFNSMAVLSFGSVPLRNQADALSYLKKAKDSLKGTPTSVRKTRLLWLEGVLLANLRISVHAERQLRKAQERLSHQPFDHALASLDLICLLVLEGDPDLAAAIAAELATPSDSPFGASGNRVLNRWSAGVFDPPPASQDARSLKEGLLAYRIPVRCLQSRGKRTK